MAASGSARSAWLWNSLIMPQPTIPNRTLSVVSGFMAPSSWRPPGRGPGARPWTRDLIRPRRRATAPAASGSGLAALQSPFAASKIPRGLAAEPRCSWITVRFYHGGFSRRLRWPMRLVVDCSLRMVAGSSLLFLLVAGCAQPSVTRDTALVDPEMTGKDLGGTDDIYEASQLAVSSF